MQSIRNVCQNVRSTESFLYRIRKSIELKRNQQLRIINNANNVTRRRRRSSSLSTPITSIRSSSSSVENGKKTILKIDALQSAYGDLTNLSQKILLYHQNEIEKLCYRLQRSLLDENFKRFHLFPFIKLEKYANIHANSTKMIPKNLLVNYFSPINYRSSYRSYRLTNRQNIMNTHESTCYSTVNNMDEKKDCSSYRLLTAYSGFSKNHHFYAGTIENENACSNDQKLKNGSSFQMKETYQFGDDACFAIKKNSAEILGIADGVGGWRLHGVNPALFSKALMQSCAKVVNESLNQTSHVNEKTLKSVLNKVCLIALDNEIGVLYSANLGDSGFAVIRRHNEMIYRSKEQQHSFNSPYQLAITPEMRKVDWRVAAAAIDNGALSDHPNMAEERSFQVMNGDVVLLGTDGLWDNLSNEMILKQISVLKEIESITSKELRYVAQNIATEAWNRGLDPDYMSPFSKAACNAYGRNDICGGKPDDITVMLAYVTTNTSDQKTNIKSIPSSAGNTSGNS
ncbi:hypothetical protein SNEBB_008957 [Seison nebaliae]|nr:hypothetical protein SNEBB_008957 [Seison nebaliae]